MALIDTAFAQRLFIRLVKLIEDMFITKCNLNGFV